MAERFTEDELNSFDKSVLIRLFMRLQDQVDELNGKLDASDQKIQLILEQLVNANRSRFGRSSEKMDDPNQICFKEINGEIVFFNEAEAVCDLEAEEPEKLHPEPPSKKKKTAGSKEAVIKELKHNTIPHYLTEEELTERFGKNGWKQLPDAVEYHYRFIPASVEVDEHRIGVYAGKKTGEMIKAPHPKGLLHGSLVSPSLAAAIMNGKYVNAVPLYRLEQEFERYGLCIPRKNMANWMIRLGEEYLGVLYDRLHELMYDYHVIQADETPVLVSKDGRNAGAKSYMWVYRTGSMYPEKPIVLYEYQRTRNASHPREFLRTFSGICVTDGYGVYHTVAKERDDLRIAGCWTHGRRMFDKALQQIPKSAQKDSAAWIVMKQIQAVYREENKLADIPADERLIQRKAVIKPLVDALFLYLKQHNHEIPAKGCLREAFTYFLNQEEYLRVFLEDGEVPIDNNASERAIRGFTIGRKNWQLIDTINGAKASAIIYSIAETAKANHLKPYDYFEYLLSEISQHMDDTSREFLNDLLPWSPKLPEHIRKK